MGPKSGNVSSRRAFAHHEILPVGRRKRLRYHGYWRLRAGHEERLTMVATPRDTTESPETEHLDAYPYGWRYVERVLSNGSVRVEQIPLTLEDVLHPQEGDQVTHSDLHQRVCVYLFNVFRGLLATMSAAVVLHDV